MASTALGRVTKSTLIHVHMHLLNKTIQNSPGATFLVKFCWLPLIFEANTTKTAKLYWMHYTLRKTYIRVCMCVPQIAEGHRKSLSHTRLSLVTMSTRTDWSKALHTHRPCLSGLQSRLAIGWVDKVTFCRRFTVPATPMSTSSESFLRLSAG